MSPDVKEAAETRMGRGWTATKITRSRVVELQVDCRCAECGRVLLAPDRVMGHHVELESEHKTLIGSVFVASCLGCGEDGWVTP